jgi:hypothetical protein
VKEVTENVSGHAYPYQSISEEARSLVFGDRNEAYGHPVEDFTKTAGFWTVYKGVAFTPEDVAMMMVLVKASRQMFRPKRDNTVDGCGYLECLERIIQARAAGVPITDWSLALPKDKGEPIFSSFLSYEENLANNGLVDADALAELLPDGATISDLVARWHATGGRDADYPAATLAECVEEWQRIRRSAEPPAAAVTAAGVKLRRCTPGEEVNLNASRERHGLPIHDGPFYVPANTPPLFQEPTTFSAWIVWAKNTGLTLEDANGLRHERGWAPIEPETWAIETGEG